MSTRMDAEEADIGVFPHTFILYVASKKSIYCDLISNTWQPLRAMLKYGCIVLFWMDDTNLSVRYDFEL